MVLTVPPHQNLLQPPYSISNAHFTTKSLSGPRSLGNPHTWWVQCYAIILVARNLWWCFGELLVPAPHEVVSICCAVAWRETQSYFDTPGFLEQLILFTIRTASVDTGSTATSHVINALSWGSSVITAAKFGVLSFLLRKKWGKATLHVHPS